MCQTEPGEKTQMSPSGHRPICSEAGRVISTFSFDPKPRQTHRISIEWRPAGHLGRSLERPEHLPGYGLRSSGIPHEGYADPVMNDGPGFHSNVPVSELTERVTQAIKASNVSSAPLVAKIVDGVMQKTSKLAPSEPNRA